MLQSVKKYGSTKKQSEMAAFIVNKTDGGIRNGNSKTEYTTEHRGNDALKQFMGLLNRQGMGEQSQDFMELFQYVAGMQLQLAVMTDELQGVKEQLSQLRENQPKTVTESLVDKVTHLQEKIANLSERLSAVKDHLAETATQAFNAFKEKERRKCAKCYKRNFWREISACRLPGASG